MFDKTHLLPFARRLQALQVDILATDGTVSALADAGVAARSIDAYTGLADSLGGRLKTLHPKIYGGILARRGLDDDFLAQNDIAPIDLVVVNCYPFADVVSGGCDHDRAIENIDIGGVTLLRAAAKNYRDVIVVSCVDDYESVIEGIESGTLDMAARRALAARAFEASARYEDAVANYFGTLGDDAQDEPSAFSQTMNLQVHRSHVLRYGENPHQTAAIYHTDNQPKASIGASIQVQGKHLSYNNLLDADTALECVKQFAAPACIIVKHANPCGAACASDLAQAYERAYRTDPTSAFGGVIAFNRMLDAETATAIVSTQFAEVVIAFGFQPDAVTLLQQKPNIRLLDVGTDPGSAHPALMWRSLGGGMLLQQADSVPVDEQAWQVVTQRQPSAEQWRDLSCGWRVVRFLHSNAVLYCQNEVVLGIGSGQTSRILAAKVGAQSAQENQHALAGSVLASDGFIPFTDMIEACADRGISALVQPGGSIRDDEVIAAADRHNIAMVFTGIRHFRH